MKNNKERISKTEKIQIVLGVLGILTYSLFWAGLLLAIYNMCF